MNVMVLGGGGFIGSHIVAELKRRGDHVVAVDRQFPILRRQWWGKADECLRQDLRAGIPSLEGVDHVIHLAADMGGVGYFHSDADPKAAANNMRIDLNVLQACKVAKVPFFYASSACAYPVDEQTFDTAHALHEGMLGGGPADAMYGEEKRFMALLLDHEPLAKTGLFHTIYGPGQEADGPRAKFPPAICRKVYDQWKGVTDSIEVWGDGQQSRSFLYIDDAVERILRVITAEHRYKGPVNIGSDEEVTVRECADWLCEHAGISPVYTFRADKPTGVTARTCDNHEFHQRYGPASLTSAADGLAKLYDWIALQDAVPLAA